MTQRGGKEKGAEEMRMEHAAWRDRRPTTTSCALCGATHEGTAAEGREWARTHREERHPETAARKRAKLTPEAQKARAMAMSEWKRRKFQGEEG